MSEHFALNLRVTLWAANDQDARDQADRLAHLVGTDEYVDSLVCSPPEKRQPPVEVEA